MTTPDPTPPKEEPSADAQVHAQMDAALKGMRKGKPPRSRRDHPPGGGGGAGEKVQFHPGTIVSLTGEDVFVELGPRFQGVIPLTEFESPPKVGDRFEFTLVSVADGLWTLSRKEARLLATWQDLAPGREVDAKVIGYNTGGLELKIGPVSAFMPASEIGLERVEDFQSFVGQSMRCEVRELNRAKRRVLLSRRSVLSREREHDREASVKSLSVGQVRHGKVEKLEPFGAFIDLGNGLTGLLHVSNISHQRVEHPSKVLTVGQELEVKVLEVAKGGQRIGVGLKQLQPDPWSTVAERFPPERVVKGKVVRLAEFGAFVELEPGIEGLVHISQLSADRVKKVQDAVKIGEEVTVRVQSVDGKARRISLSRKTQRGSLIGSDEDVSAEDLKQHLRTALPATTLGSLLQKALEAKKTKE
jgi:ribosomal protein S1